jgi:hypothetical protein
MRHRRIQILALIILVCAMIGGLAYVLQSHAQQVESFPPYSSFRTLPEGTSILYDALRRTSGMNAERNTQPFGALRSGNAALLMLGIQPASLAGNGQWFSDMEALAGKGNRVIIGLLPHRHRFVQTEKEQIGAALKRWSIELAFVRESDLRDQEDGALVSGWPMYFARSAGWNVTRNDSGRAVVIERPEGKGSLVLMANSYLLTNAAMVDDRQTEFLAGLLGSVHQTIFDETHFGIEETGSIAGLARRYRLQGLVLGLVITSLLFIWKSAAGFPPALGGREPTASLMGEDSSSAFLNLLRRNIRQDDILVTCVDAWRKMYERKAGPGLAHAVQIAESGRKTPVSTYAQIQQILGAKQNQS